MMRGRSTTSSPFSGSHRTQAGGGETSRKRGRYRSLVENIDLGITIVDRNHRILLINPAHARMVGRSIEQCLGEECFQVFKKRAAACAAMRRRDRHGNPPPGGVGNPGRARRRQRLPGQTPGYSNPGPPRQRYRLYRGGRRHYPASARRGGGGEGQGGGRGGEPRQERVPGQHEP